MKPTTLRDSGMHYSATPARIERPRDEDELRAVLADARRLGPARPRATACSRSAARSR